MMQGDQEPKKNFYLVYGVIAALYVIMLIVYSVVVHNATANQDARNVDCSDPHHVKYCYTPDQDEWS